MLLVEQDMLYALKWGYNESLGNTRVERTSQGFVFVVVKGVPIYVKRSYTQKSLRVEPKTKLEKSRLEAIATQEQSELISRDTMDDLYKLFFCGVWSSRRSFFRVDIPNGKVKYFATESGAKKFASERGYSVLKN